MPPATSQRIPRVTRVARKERRDTSSSPLRGLHIDGNASTAKRLHRMRRRAFPHRFGRHRPVSRQALFKRDFPLKSCNSHNEFRRRSS
ncbi:hypothetical protein F9948_08520 [Burkholderia thailandensis]|nr:hypothetical protein [Burkholderia thailandensis]MDD1485351.1 hypothetical protein [Burkholderia thailandensis]MDD1494418.1 hypothetical protein [Burkholderia thailandensis]